MTSRNDAVDLGIRQFCHAWRVLCAGGPRPAVAAGDGIEFVFSGLPIGFFNAALVTARGVSEGALMAKAQEACEWAADKGVPYLFVVTHEGLAADVDPAALLAGSLAPVMPLTGMLAQRIAPAARVPEPVQLVEPDDDDACASMLDVNAVAYGMDLEAGKNALGRRAFWEGHVPVLGLADGKPVSSAAVFMVDGYRYVALVATDPSYQRRGYDEAAMRRALEVAAERHGDCPTVLHATDAGRPIYARMGYETISTHTLFMEQRFLEGH
jgi:ribosomal protein S18 acetylase RimI-like enzyme